VRLTRRELVRLGVAGALAAGVPACRTPADPDAEAYPFRPGEPLPWRNWADNQRCRPALRMAPASEAELLDRLRASGGPLRPVGAGHSFSALVPTDGALLSLDLLEGLASVDPERQRAEVWAGTRLHALGPLLQAAGQALPNQPDVDYQALGGAIATSTHGTGAGFGSLSSYVTGLALATPSGELIECDAEREPEVFQAARCSLGALGVVTRLTLRNRAPFRLAERTRAEPLEDVLDDIERRRRDNPWFEFHALPRTRQALVVETREASEDDEAYGTEDPSAVYLLRDVYGWVGRIPVAGDWLYERLLRTEADSVEALRVGPSFRVLAHPRIARFREMEYSVPADAGPDCLREILRLIRDRDLPIVFPIEYRYVAADDVWLSMFHERDTCTISVHQYADEDHRAYFDAVEPVFWKYEGRPHWGKLHSLDAFRLQSRYPRWGDFLAVRDALDPQGRLLNPHLAHLLGR